MNRVLLEVAVESYEAAIAAADSGADRLELCSELHLGGLSPTLELFQRIRAAVSNPIVVMIRPRAGNFCYTEAELEWMLERMGALHPDGFVFGALHSNGAIDLATCAKLRERCGAIPAVFHRAWDELPRTPEDLELLITLGFTRLLTSGSAATATAGVEAIAELNRLVAGRLEILPGAGITPANVAEIVRRTGCTQVHGTFKNCVREVRAVLDQLTAAGGIASG